MSKCLELNKYLGSSFSMALLTDWLYSHSSVPAFTAEVLSVRPATCLYCLNLHHVYICVSSLTRRIAQAAEADFLNLHDNKNID